MTATPTGDGGERGFRGPGYSVINKFGVNLDIDTATVPEVIWAHGGVFPFLSAGITMDIISSSALDTFAGTGAQTVQITHYDDANIETVATYNMAGAARVELPGNIKIVTRIEVTQAGSGTTNAGKISIVDRTTGLIVYQTVEIGEGQTLSAVQIVPAGKKGLITRLYAEYARRGAAFNDANMRFRVRKNNGTFLTKLPTVISPNHADHDHKYDIGGIEASEGDIIFWECTDVSGNDTPIAAGFDIEFEDIDV